MCSVQAKFKDVCCLAKYFMNHYVDFKVIIRKFLLGVHLQLINVWNGPHRHGPVEKYIKQNITWPIIDFEVRFGEVVAESHSQHRL